MAQVERQEEERKSRKANAPSKRGAGRRQRGSLQEGWQLSFTHWLWLNVLMEAVASCGGAVRFGFTRDGGAIALGVYMGDDYGTEYIKPSEDFETALKEIADAWLPNDGKPFTAAQIRFNKLFEEWQVSGGNTP